MWIWKPRVQGFQNGSKNPLAQKIEGARAFWGHPPRFLLHPWSKYYIYQLIYIFSKNFRPKVYILWDFDYFAFGSVDDLKLRQRPRKGFWSPIPDILNIENGCESNASLHVLNKGDQNSSETMEKEKLDWLC